MGDRRRGGGGAPADSRKKAGLASQADAPTRIKVLSTGSCAVGKSCLIKRYCEERFVTKYIATIGVDYGVKPVMVDSAEIRVNFWDLSGHPEFFEIRNEFYKDAQGVVVVFDVANRDSFEALDGWLAEASKFGASPKDLVFTVCANKADLVGKKRVVSEDEGRQFAKNRGLMYFETSANDGQNVREMFEYLFTQVVRRARA